MAKHGQRPNELVVKKLSMLGCVALVLAHSVKDMQDKLRGVPCRCASCWTQLCHTECGLSQHAQQA